jgi:glucokinase
MYGIPPEKIVIGVDIGGTNIAVAAISPEGDVLARTGGPTLPRVGPEDGVRRILDLIREAQRMAGDRDFVGIGIGCTGPVDRFTGRVHNPYTLPTWEDFPLTDRLRETLNVPVVIENDALAGALGEHWRGAGCRTRHMIYVTVGTGVGGGIILNGTPYTGATGKAGEIGHQSVDMNGPECYCGGRGCVEMYAAAPALTKQARERVQSQESMLLSLVDGDPGALNPEVIAKAAREGDRVACDVIKQAAQALGVGLRNLAIILAPEVIVLGGGVMRSFDLFKPTIEETLNHLALPLGDLRIVCAELGMNAGVVGAARALLDACCKPLWRTQ